MAKLHSRDLADKWAALQTAVPCLHPSHKFQKVVEGPERAVVFTPGPSTNRSSGSSGSSGSFAAATPAPAADSKEQQGNAAAAALAAVSLQDGGSGGAAAASGAAAADGPARPADGLEDFLSAFQPSACSCSDVAWLVVEVGNSSSSAGSSGSNTAPAAGGSGGSSSSAAQAGPSLEERVDAAVEEWEKLAASGRKLTAADVDRLAAKHRILKGERVCGRAVGSSSHGQHAEQWWVQGFCGACPGYARLESIVIPLPAQASGCCLRAAGRKRTRPGQRWHGQCAAAQQTQASRRSVALPRSAARHRHPTTATSSAATLTTTR